ncbi:unnamed protein product [Kluyveromyces dobzhanskii CBS 2104]|uniref:Protein PBN1 n=1 Tax=Kluyveromyces dobzhanskii CBS 2104 TaxID=1427455 RepID=A0A0A8L3C7_9SACH|nr:unnamed protein product [Kluyveromyces dobzhanskii CBS 2104]
MIGNGEPKVLLLEKRRITVLFHNDEQALESKILNAGGILTLKNENGHVQDRLTFALPPTTARPSYVHITWNRKAEAGITPIKNHIPFGLNIFTNTTDTIPGFIDTPLGKIYYNDKFNESVLSDWLPSHFFDQLHLYSENNNLDVTVTEDRVILNRYYELKDDNPFPVNGTDLVKTEAGIFQVDTDDEDDSGLTGVRCVWDTGSGDLRKCQKTLFYLKQIHVDRSLPGSVPLSLLEPVNLHPTVSIDLRSQRAKHGCEYYVFFNLPKYLFIDQFQSSPTFLFGEHDLELPEYKLSGFGSISLFTLKPGMENNITLNSRYVKPAESGSGYFETTFAPQVFCACDTPLDLTYRSPFYTEKTGYERYFTDNTRYYFLNSTQLSIKIPQLDSSDNPHIQLVTMGLIIISVLYLFKKLL